MNKVFKVSKVFKEKPDLKVNKEYKVYKASKDCKVKPDHKVSKV